MKKTSEKISVELQNYVYSARIKGIVKENAQISQPGGFQEPVQKKRAIKTLPLDIKTFFSCHCGLCQKAGFV